MSGPDGGDGEVLGHLEDEVGRAQGPALGELRGGGGRSGGVALRGARLGPGDERGDLGRGERPVVLELRARPRATGFHGGIDRSSATAAMSLARLRACS